MSEEESAYLKSQRLSLARNVLVVRPLLFDHPEAQHFVEPAGWQAPCALQDQGTGQAPALAGRVRHGESQKRGTLEARNQRGGERFATLLGQEGVFPQEISVTRLAASNSELSARPANSSNRSSIFILGNGSTSRTLWLARVA